MKYRTISINESYRNLGLVKYTDFYKNQLEELKKINFKLANCIEQYPKIYDENSQIQSYMIIQNVFSCLGMLVISPVQNEENLKVEIQLSEDKFGCYNQMLDVLDDLIKSLKIFFYDKKNLEIILNNNIDLEKSNYKPLKINTTNKSIYLFSNENNYIIPALVKEVENIERNLRECGYSWTLKIENDQLDKYYDQSLIKALKDNNITYFEIFSKFKKFTYLLINSNKLINNITFYNDGLIEYDINCKTENYKIVYSILNDSFHLEYINKSTNNNIVMKNLSNLIQIKQNELKVIHNNDIEKNFINYDIILTDNITIGLNLVTNKLNQIDMTNINFKINNPDKKLQNVYNLTLFKSALNDEIIIKLEKLQSIKDTILSVNNLIESTVNDNLTLDLISSYILKAISIINIDEITINKDAIINDFEEISIKLEKMFYEASNILSEVQNVIDTPNLRNSLDTINIYISKTPNNYKLLKK